MRLVTKAMSVSRRSPASRDWGASLLAALGAYVVLYRLWSFTSSLPPEQRTFWSDLAVLPLLVPFVLARRASRTPDLDAGTRKAWSWLALAFLFNWLGDVLWVVYTYLLPREVFLVLHHAAYVLLYPAMLIGLLSFPGFLRTRGEALQFGLDAAIVLLGGFMLFWSMIYGPAATLAGRDVASLARSICYPLGDLLMLLTVSMLAARHWREPIRLVFLLFLVGLLASLVDNAAYGFQLLSGTGSIALADESLYMFGWFFFAASAQAQRRLALAQAQAIATVGAAAPAPSMSLLPYMAAGVGYGTLFVAVLQHHTAALVGLVIGAALLTAVVLVRQAIAIRENMRLVAERAARESEAALRKSEQRTEERTAQLDALIANSPLAIVAMDTSTCIQFVNPAFERIFQYGQDEAAGKTLDSLVVPDDPALHAESDEFRREALAGGTIHATTVRRRKDGTHVDVEVYGLPMTAGGRSFGFYAIYNDVTEQKQLSERLRQAQKMEAIGQLAGGVAHDFNNILTAILGYSDVLLDTTGSEDSRHEDLQEIHKAAERAASLTNQLLAFSRRQLLRPQVLDLGALVGNLGNMLRRLIGENIEFSIRAAPTAGHVKADPGQVEQAVLNLAVNAREAMPDGGRLEIAIQDVTVPRGHGPHPEYVEPGRYVAMTVSDTGTGMDSHVRAHLFEPFFTTKESGTGLGLATVYGMVKQSGGYIWAQSEPQRGSTLTLYFPSVEEELEPQKVEICAPRERGTETILIVEDEEALRRLTHRLLSGFGYTVFDAESAEAALHVFRSHHGEIHLMLTDVVLPGLNGWELARILSAERPSTRVLFMSGYTDGQIPAAAASDVSWKLLQKPFSAGQLASEVRSALDRSNA
jgi:two-component system cell cycle sensor histidine kinase/response regulator CckA